MTYAIVVSNSAKNGELAENNTHGAIAGNNHDIEGASVLTNFAVIEIVDDSNP